MEDDAVERSSFVIDLIENRAKDCKEVSLPNLEVLDIYELENLERLGHGPLSVGSFSKLKRFFVGRCAKLLCVITSQFLPMLRELQKLTVESCDSLEVVFELEGLESNDPNPEILPPLKSVKLRELPKLNCISKRDPVGIKYIQTLEIHNCNSLRYVFAPTMTKSIPQLRKLDISSCKMLSRIMAEENGSGEGSVNEVEFPQLESLQLLYLPDLVSFFPNVNVNGNTTTLAKSIDRYHNPLQPQPLFNEKANGRTLQVAFPGLEYLGLSGLETVSDLWCSVFGTDLHQNPNPSRRFCRMYYIDTVSIQSFLLEIPSYPKLWNEAYSISERYTTMADAAEVVRKAESSYVIFVSRERSPPRSHFDDINYSNFMS